jgi:uncharacterized membrane protein YphA (DoxX/SURF4 family)
MRLRNLPTRLATGAYIAHSGLEKFGGGPEQAAGVHAMAAAAFPFLKGIEANRFLRTLSIGEMATGALLLAPVAPPLVAGAALTGFSGALVAMYLRTPDLHQPGSIWPTPQGIAVSKDVWMLGIGVGLMIDGLRNARNTTDA